VKKNRSIIQPVLRKPKAIKTSLLEMLKELGALTQDDALVLALFKHIFASHRVRLARTLAPVALARSDWPRRPRAGGSRKTRAWA
jgi:hypothetical protein